jgi:hypothetical protein
LCLLGLEQLVGLDLGNPYYSSVGTKTSDPYTIKNGVKLVDLLGIVWRLQSNERTSAAHFPALGLS